jgi:hypothetical protein
MDVFKPRGASQPRKATSDQQKNGQIINTPRFSRFGGLTNAGKTGSKNDLAVKPPGDGRKVI